MMFGVAAGSAAALALAVAVAMFGQTFGLPVGGSFPLTGQKSYIAWHAVLMTWAFGALMPLGRWMYHVGTAPKPEKRMRHLVLMVAAVLCMLGGYYGIFKSHQPMHRYFGYNFEEGAFKAPLSRFVHIYLGYLVVLSSIAQACMGGAKAQKMAAEGEDKKSFTFHGQLGKVIIVGGCTNVVVAAYFWGWSVQFKLVIVLFAALCGVIGAFMDESSTKSFYEGVPIAAPDIELDGAPKHD